MFVSAIVLAGLISGVVGYRFVVGGKRRHDICVQVEIVKTIVREDKQTQLRRSLAYLKENPRGAPGIPRKLIIQGIADQRKTIKELRRVKC